MMLGRALAIVMLIGSIAAATFTRDAPSIQLLASGDYAIVTADFHVHGFLGDGALPPSEIRREAARRGLDAVVITNHNQMYAASLDRALFAAPRRPLFIAGEELTTPDYHVIALGIREPVDWRLPLADAIREIHAQGGIAIGAHPVGAFWDRVDSQALALLDGLEVAHPIALNAPKERARVDAVFARARQANPAIAAIGSSDYHFGAPIGFCRTRLFVRDVSLAGVFDAIHEGRTVAYDPDGTAHGDPRWVEAAAQFPFARPNSADKPLHHITMIAAWISLVILIVFGASRRSA